MMTIVLVPELFVIVSPVAGMVVPSQAVPPFVSVVKVAPDAKVITELEVVRVTVPPEESGIVQVLAPVPENVSDHVPVSVTKPPSTVQLPQVMVSALLAQDPRALE